MRSLPNALAPTGFDLLPHHMAEFATDFAKSGFINIMGGCCGNTPAHIEAIAKAVKGIEPRHVPSPEPIMRLSGTMAYNHTKLANYLMIGERTNVAGSPKFAKLIKEGKLEEAVSVARQQVENGANVIDVCMDEGLIDGVEMTERDLVNSLEKHGVRKLDPLGQKFDPHMHQAVFEIPTTEQPAGTVMQVMQSGYVIGDRVLRPAMVGVAKGAPKPKEVKTEADDSTPRST